MIDNMIHLDGINSTLSNALTGMGYGQYDPTQGFRLNTHPGQCLTEEQQSELMRRHGLLRKVVNTIPKAATSRWGEPTLKEGKPSQLEKIAEALEKIPCTTATRRYSGARKSFQVAMADAFRTGNAGIVMDVDDGKRMDEPLDLDNIKTLRQLFILDRWSLCPDTLGLGFGQSGIHHYTVRQKTQIIGASEITGKIHASRVLWFAGAETDDCSRRSNQGCDDSILEGVVRAFVLYLSAIEGAGRMIQDFDVMIHKISGLMTEFGLCDSNGTSAPGKGGTAGEKLKERLRCNQVSKSVYRGMVIDKDKEELSQVTRSVGGYSDLLQMLKDHLLSETEYPPAILFGEFSSGIDASGRSNEEKQLWNETIGNAQAEKLHHLMIGSILGEVTQPGLLQVICLAKDGPTKGKIPEGLGWKWNTVYPPTEQEKCEAELKRTQIMGAIAALDPRFTAQALLSHYGGDTFKETVTISPEYRGALEAEAKTLKPYSPDQGGEAAPEGEAATEAGLTPEEEAELAELEALEADEPEEKEDSLDVDTSPDLAQWLESGEVGEVPEHLRAELMDIFEVVA